jgi:phage terminase large subunit
MTCSDEGYTNPAVILVIGVDGDGRLHIAKEYYRRGVLQSVVVAEAKSRRDEFRAGGVAVDNSAAGLIADLQDAGIPAIGQKGRVLDGITAVQNLLKVQGDGKPRLTVDPSCIETINEFESYVWKPDKDEPVKENDHALDALRYALFIAGVSLSLPSQPASKSKWTEREPVTDEGAEVARWRKY